MVVGLMVIYPMVQSVKSNQQKQIHHIIREIPQIDSLVFQNPPNTLWGSVFGSPKRRTSGGPNTDPHKVWLEDYKVGPYQL